jgi:hypothetical protein
LLNVALHEAQVFAFLADCATNLKYWVVSKVLLNPKNQVS